MPTTRSPASNVVTLISGDSYSAKIQIFLNVLIWPLSNCVTLMASTCDESIQCQQILWQRLSAMFPSHYAYHLNINSSATILILPAYILSFFYHLGQALTGISLFLSLLLSRRAFFWHHDLHVVQAFFKPRFLRWQACHRPPPAIF